MASSEGQWRLLPRSALPPSEAGPGGSLRVVWRRVPTQPDLVPPCGSQAKREQHLASQGEPMPFVLGLWHLLLHPLCPGLAGLGLWCPCPYPQRKTGWSVVWCRTRVPQSGKAREAGPLGPAWGAQQPWAALGDGSSQGSGWVGSRGLRCSWASGGARQALSHGSCGCLSGPLWVSERVREFGCGREATGGVTWAMWWPSLRCCSRPTGLPICQLQLAESQVSPATPGLLW